MPDTRRTPSASAFLNGKLDKVPAEPEPTQLKKKTSSCVPLPRPLCALPRARTHTPRCTAPNSFIKTSTRLTYEERFPDADYVPDDLADMHMTPAEVRRSHRLAARGERLGAEPLVELSDSDDEDEGELTPVDFSTDSDEDVKPIVPRPAEPKRRHKRKMYEAPIVLSDDDEPAAPVNKRARCVPPPPRSPALSQTRS